MDQKPNEFQFNLNFLHISPKMVAHLDDFLKLNLSSPIEEHGQNMVINRQMVEYPQEPSRLSGSSCLFVRPAATQPWNNNLPRVNKT